MRKRLFFIYNPHAGKEHIRGKLYGIIQAMADADYEITIYPTKCYLDAMEQIIALPDCYDLVVCSGGDGTLDEVVSGMMQRRQRLPIGYIPAGTCNDFARSMKIPGDMTKAAQIAVTGERFACDVGSFNENSFVYIAAFGIFTDVSYSTKQEMKNVLGHMAYLMEGMKRLKKVRSYELKVTSQEMSFEGDFLFGMVTNSKSVGGFKSIIGKNVIFDDGVFEVTFIRRPSNALKLQEILAALVVEEIDSKYMYSFRSSRIVVESEEKIPWTLDGEFGGEHSHVEIRNNRQAVDIIIAKERRAAISLEAALEAEGLLESQRLEPAGPDTWESPGEERLLLPKYPG